jgi:uncharacterized OB-fold protein
MSGQAKDALRVEYEVNFEYRYAVGRYGTRFMTALRDEARLYGTRCTECHRVLVPPRPVCGICAARTEEWVEVGPTGTITGYTVVETPFIDPMTGKQRPVPYGFAFIRLDGADTNIYHFLSEHRHDQLEVGMAVEAVLKPDGEREGKLSDILHFRLVEGKST